MNARIYKPTKTAMQSGKRNTKDWIIEFPSPNAQFVEPIMGWTSSSDTVSSQVHLRFSTLEEAEDYAKRNNIAYEVIQPQTPKKIIKTYISNFQ